MCVCLPKHRLDSFSQRTQGFLKSGILNNNTYFFKRREDDVDVHIYKKAAHSGFTKMSIFCTKSHISSAHQQMIRHW